jgi:hypothetical protein
MPECNVSELFVRGFCFLQIDFSVVKDKVGKMFFTSHVCLFPVCAFIKVTISDNHHLKYKTGYKPMQY